jgi:hypothetical protein
MSGFWDGVASVSIAVAVLAGCGTLRQAQDDALPGAGTAGVGQGSSAVQTARGDLLYVTGGCGGTCILSYPKGRPVGALSIGGAGICSDKHGNVFIPTSTTSGSAAVYEFAHGATSPKATLSLSGILAEGCGVDPKTGNLAVTYLCHACNYGPVAIFKNAQGTPTSYDEEGVFLSFCGYDNQGNLFADGNGGTGFSLLELPHGGSALTPISVGQTIANAGQVQWDGTYLAIEDLSHPTIYQFAVSGSAATLKGTTQLTGAGDWGAQSWIQGGSAIVPYAASGSSPSVVGYWKYPAGGSATKRIKKHLGTGVLAGVTVSVGK